ncbi:MAG TPA: aminotransferase class IV [Acidimicrobiales bacterium]|nr:aminotransferase class IV [Acidimicrobiales bacterium]
MPEAPPTSIPPAVAVVGRGLVDPGGPVVRADDLGLTRGDGCFEGIRVVDGAAEDLDAHLDRMARSAAGLDLPFDRAGFEAAAAEVIAASGAAGVGEASLKLVLTRGPEHDPGHPTGLATLAPLTEAVRRARRQGISVATLTRGWAPGAFDGAPWLLGGVKTLSYAVNTAAMREAARRGADDALFTDAGGALLEGPTWSVAWLRGDRLTTVDPAPHGCLRSVTTDRLLADAATAGLTPALGAGTVDDLRAADLVLAVSSVRGGVEVGEVDGQPLRAADTRAVGWVRRHLAGRWPAR